MENHASVEPSVAELIGGQQVWADGGFVRFGREVHTVIFYREDAGCRTEVIRIMMPPSGFAGSLIKTWQAWTKRGH